MPKIVFTEQEKTVLEVLDRAPASHSNLKDILNQEFAPQSSSQLMSTLSELKTTGYIRTIGTTGVGLTEKGHRVVGNDFEQELGEVDDLAELRRG